MEDTTEQYMVFHSGEYVFGIPNQIVQEILVEYLLEKIPWQSNWADGILYYKDQIIPVICFGKGKQQMAVICCYGEQLVAYLASDVENGLLEDERDSDNRSRVYGNVHLYPDALWNEFGEEEILN